MKASGKGQGKRWQINNREKQSMEVVSSLLKQRRNYPPAQFKKDTSAHRQNLPVSCKK